MFKKVINNEDLQKKQSEVCELVSQIWDAEALELIHGSVRSIITIKKLVMMVDASCGSSQIYTQPPIQDIGQIEEEEEEDIDDIPLTENGQDLGMGQDADAGDHILVKSSPPFEKLAVAPESPPMYDEEGEYLTQIICDTPAPPRITIVEEPEDNEWESIFGNIDDIVFESDNEDEEQQLQQENVGVDNEEEEEEEQQQEEQQQENVGDDNEERQRVVDDYLSTPLEQINAQCPYFLTRQEAAKLLWTDFSPIKEVHHVPEVATGQRAASPLTQSNTFILLKTIITSSFLATKDIIQAAQELDTLPIPQEVPEDPQPQVHRVDREEIQAASVSACEQKKRKRRQPTEEERQIKRARKVQKAIEKAATEAANNVGTSKSNFQ